MFKDGQRVMVRFGKTVRIGVVTLAQQHNAFVLVKGNKTVQLYSNSRLIADNGTVID